MKSKLTIVLFCILASILLISVGFGRWQKELTIVGNIKVVPDPVVLTNMNSQLERLQNQLEEQKSYEEQQRMIAEQEKIKLEQEKLQEEQNILDEKVVEQIPEKNSGEIINDNVEEINQDVTIENNKEEIENISGDEDEGDFDKNDDVSNTEIVEHEANEKSENFRNDIEGSNNESKELDKKIEETNCERGEAGGEENSRMKK